MRRELRGFKQGQAIRFVRVAEAGNGHKVADLCEAVFVAVERDMLWVSGRPSFGDARCRVDEVVAVKLIDRTRDFMPFTKRMKGEQRLRALAAEAES